ncbi:aminotransferase class III-fold pyridoxal phosphate-dependent enzyme [Vibrio cholerae]|uniref:aminotransferase class III-fold pyridoxal phosphate-dependent enzyme n=1 Tax=Vibrio cholerae TaxID=666 RepID=UPI0011DB8C5D|nr:aminotransferase class III-fold pyridoxal phosphate-dependent enzyme [Vibrio cholerae]EGQ8013619.1 aminotransferase class III-fold pyridoxal phosphate-dependent enzyme [Vibrio cholerae]EGR2500515.1 aminotransferase class III-fold pyridoxal phosphate-dependent enzyme [Vibrio cholerae]EGR4315267.1 aminotransferase class III-fold pyridoxal phosphate-dependent enzyme [Vibrio cholerae]ELJ8712307.1 aminotransferase class III-fold pyridoxal phosphate-dependent enzyme [Vibrio cholerae]NAR19744.1 am
MKAFEPLSPHSATHWRSEGDINTTAARRDWLTHVNDETTQNLLQRDANVFLHQAMSTPCLDVLASAAGCYLYDVSGKSYLDFHGNNVHQLGHGHPQVIEKVTEQMQTLPFAPRRFTHETAIRCAEKLTEIAGGKLNRVLFAPGGTSVIGMALKLARHVTQNFKVVSLWDAFHGASLDAISVGGEWFTHQAFGIEPDILCIGKGLGAGLIPIAALLTKEKYNTAAQVSLGHYTHEKSPLGCAAALASIEVIEQHNLLAKVQADSVYMRQRLNQMQQQFSLIGDVRGIGLLWGIELVTDRETKQRAHDEAEAILYHCLRNGLSFKVSQGNVLQLSPPLIISLQELDQALNILYSALLAISQQMGYSR